MNNEWSTPEYVFNYLNNIFNFDFDAAASEKNTKCKNWSNDSLDLDWSKEGKTIWLNPPYSRGNLPMFMKKAYEESLKGITVVCLVPLDITGWVRDWVIDKALIWIPDERMCFIDPQTGFPGERPSKGNMIVIYNLYCKGIKYIHIPNFMNVG